MRCGILKPANCPAMERIHCGITSCRIEFLPGNDGRRQSHAWTIDFPATDECNPKVLECTLHLFHRAPGNGVSVFDLSDGSGANASPIRQFVLSEIERNPCCTDELIWCEHADQLSTSSR